MPEKVNDLDASRDPSVAKQYDDKSSAETKFQDFYKIADDRKICMMVTYRNGIGPVSRSMAVAKRTGPDFLFLANASSKKFDDLKNKETCLIFHDSNENWISVTGEAVTTSNDDPRIKEIYSKPVSAWFGDLGDGVHTGGPEDPRMKLIEIRSKYISYWKKTTGALATAKEIGGAALTGRVANTGDLREMKGDEIAQARKRDSPMSKQTLD